MTAFLRNGEARRVGYSAKPGRFGTKADGISRAIHVWQCRICQRIIDRGDGKRPPASCTICGRELVHFPSLIEARRGGELMLLEKLGKIELLRFHPRFELRVNSILVCRYEADASYVDRASRQTVVEDVKPRGFMTDEATLKIALFNALYAPQGIKVTIIER